jgi:flavin reductase (DIM6/NTAB) family NADH-FMN oxidoreductase RutF
MVEKQWRHPRSRELSIGSKTKVNIISQSAQRQPDSRVAHDPPPVFKSRFGTRGADPPLMLVSIDRRTAALQTILAARHFALKFLPREAAEIADSFGGKGPQKGAARFATGRWGTLRTGAPILLDAVGVMDCRLVETIERHGVIMAIGRVVGTRDGADTMPLIHFRGGYLP